MDNGPENKVEWFAYLVIYLAIALAVAGLALTINEVLK
jgi:hypothetical protein